MVFQCDRIIRDVRVAIDENVVSTALDNEGDVDALSLGEVIRSKILDGVRLVHCSAPAWLLEGGHNFGDAVYWGDLESGWVLLPQDFMRLVVFQMSDWEQAVYAAISSDSAEYEKQRSRYKAMRGNAERPVCAYGIRPEGRVLEFYSCKSEDAYVSKAVYLPYPDIDEDDGVDISERCYKSVVYTIAGLTLEALGDAERAKVLMEIGGKLLC